MIPVWPATLPPFAMPGGWRSQPLPQRASFVPERGPSIDRRATTARTLQVQAQWPAMTGARRAVADAFFDATLQGGVLAFAMCDPGDGLVWNWKVAPNSEPEFEARGADLWGLNLTLHRQPGPPWWQPYALVSASWAIRLPWAVADYANNVFGVDLARTAAGAVAAVTGTFDVYTTAAGGSVTVQAAEAVSAGEIPASAPVGVTKIVAYLP